ncbi:hypothetical protein L3Q82_008630 [Scortum barcoo]|uniref:Uncharacterized protein n=1 Tax=Scortum barcoo TaxID=214431 RepID=A0ACB8XCG8_9TELE|nr:hypothetical protein L3Q82_008630 [Scortum barcoo]
MDDDQQLKGHISIQKGISFPPMQKCSCCTPSKFHCPFCLPNLFKPTKYSKARIHLDNHTKKAVSFGDYTIHRCGLGCRKQTHFHCMYCTSTLLKKKDFTNHLLFCQLAQQRIAIKLSKQQAAVTRRVQIEGMIAPSLTPGDSDLPLFKIESNKDSDDKTGILDSGEQSGQSVTPIIFKSNKCEAGGMNMEPRSSKCDRTVQTNTEKPQDCDEFYFMKLVKMFKKLSPQKQADVRMKIERLLFEAEFE